MTGRKHLYRTGLVALLAIGLFVCSVATGIGQPATSVSAQGPFVTVRPQDATFPPVVETPIPGPTLIPTLGAGQYFEGDNRPEVYTEAGDERFGYGRLVEDPALYAVWVTVGSRTRYFIVEGDSDALWGDHDSVTGERRENGFDDLVRSRDESLRDLSTAYANRETQLETVEWFRWGTLGTLALAGACILITGGTCLPLIAAAGVPAWFMVASGSDASLEQNAVNGFIQELAAVESRLVSRFDVGVALETSP